MDVGVGTGYYLAESVRELEKLKTREVCLVDINPTSLQMASGRLKEAGFGGEVETLRHDVFAPLPKTLQGRFDAVSLFFLLHCLPGRFPEKAERVLETLVPALTANGTLYGSTILGKGVTHGVMGRFLTHSYNRRRIFGNEHDDEKGLRRALEGYFEEVEVTVCGTVALFAARRPRKDGGEYPLVLGVCSSC